jgi:hypothetical protein
MKGGVMARLMWNAIGERIFEAGIDRGVLYVEEGEGVPWNGLISVTESPSGGEVTPHYIDGIKYLDEVGNEEFEATIEAYTYPKEFASCDGTVLIENGLFATKQPKKYFGLSFRTKVGNDVDGVDHGYKVHLVYGATASPTERPNNTMSETIEPYNFSWSIFTKPKFLNGFKPTSHFVIDSREAPELSLSRLEDILYGTEDTPPRMPEIYELYVLFSDYHQNVWDAGTITDAYLATIDAGIKLFQNHETSLYPDRAGAKTVLWYGWDEVEYDPNHPDDEWEFFDNRPPVFVELIQWKYGSTDFVLNEPTQPGDLILYCQSRRMASAAAPPAPWIQVGAGGNSSHITCLQAYRFSPGGEINIPSMPSGRNHILVLRNVDPVNPLVDWKGVYATGQPVTIPTMNAVEKGMLVGGWGSGRNPDYWGTYATSAPANMVHVHRFNTSNDSHPVLVGVETMLDGVTASMPRAAGSSNGNNYAAVVGSMWRPKGS